jgi:hypothetical protein
MNDEESDGQCQNRDNNEEYPCAKSSDRRLLPHTGEDTTTIGPGASNPLAEESLAELKGKICGVGSGGLATSTLNP